MPIGSIISLQTYSAGLAVGSSVERIIGTKQSGPAGIEAVIEYNGVFLNERSWIDTFIVETIDGIDDADVRDTRDELPGDHGEAIGQAWYGGRTIVLQGYVETKTLWKLRDMEQGLRQAFADISREYPLRFHSHDPTLTLEINCKKSQKLQIVEAQSTLNDFKRNFSITLRASNPRFTTREEIYASNIMAAATFDDIAFTLQNHGNFPAQPFFYITGPFTTFAMDNEANNMMLELVDPIPSGETWIFDTSLKRLYESETLVSKYQSITDTSEAVLLEPAPTSNSIHVEATGATAGTSMVEVRYHHTFI